MNTRDNEIERLPIDNKQLEAINSKIAHRSEELFHMGLLGDISFLLTMSRAALQGTDNRQFMPAPWELRKGETDYYWRCEPTMINQIPQPPAAQSMDLDELEKSLAEFKPDIVSGMARINKHHITPIMKAARAYINQFKKDE